MIVETERLRVREECENYKNGEWKQGQGAVKLFIGHSIAYPYFGENIAGFGGIFSTLRRRAAMRARRAWVSES